MVSYVAKLPNYDVFAGSSQGSVELAAAVGEGLVLMQ